MSQLESSPPDKSLPIKRATAFQITNAIAWSFLGVRKLQSYEDDIARITPIQAIIGGGIGVALFITTVLVLVNLAIKYLS